MSADLSLQLVDLAHEADFRLGDASVHPSTREVMAGERREVLEPRVMQVLTLLARRRGEVVSRDDLIRGCWDGRVVGEDAINRAIAGVRRLGERLGGFAVETVPRVGYRLSELAGAGTSPTGRPAPRQRVLIGLSALTIAAVVLAGGMWVHSKSVLVDVAPPTVAVLPFEPTNTEPDAQMLADALSSGIADTLSRAGLPVIAPASSFEFRGPRKAQAGRALSADYLIDGGLSRRGDVLKVAVRVVDAPRGVNIWAQSFDFPAERPELAGPKIAGEIAEFMTWPSAARILQASEGADPRLAAEVWRAVMASRRQDYAEGYPISRRLGLKYPNVAMAQGGWAIQTNFVLRSLPLAERASALAEAKIAARRSVALDPTQGDYYLAQALVTPPIAWAEREAYFRQGLRVDPNSQNTRGFYAGLLLSAGRIDEAMIEEERSVALDPLSTGKTSVFAFIKFARGRQDEALDLIRRARSTRPAHPLAAHIHLTIATWGGRPKDGEALLSDPAFASVIAATGPIEPLKAIVRAAVTRRPEDADAMESACLRNGPLAPLHQQQCLGALAALGRIDAAYRLADRMFPDQRAATRAEEERLWLQEPEALTGTSVVFTPMAAAFRADPRFLALTERTGLRDYWRTSRQPPDFCRTERVAACQGII